jgi:hypothetical protein
LSPYSGVILFAGSNLKQYYKDITKFLAYLYEIYEIYIIFSGDRLSDSKLFVRNILADCRFLASDNLIIFVEKFPLFSTGINHLFGWHS